MRVSRNLIGRAYPALPLDYDEKKRSDGGRSCLSACGRRKAEQCNALQRRRARPGKVGLTPICAPLPEDDELIITNMDIFLHCGQL
jgi:hypothetical protein